MTKQPASKAPRRPVKARRSKKPAGGLEIREALRRAAERLFRERSPGDVTLREIAAKAGVNYSLVYRYFKTKDALLAAVFYAVTPTIRKDLVDAPEGQPALRDLQLVHDATGYARALAWALLENMDLDLLFVDPDDGEDAIDRPKPRPVRVTKPKTDAEIDSRIVMASFLALTMGWDLYGPYLTRITGTEHVDKSVLNEHIARIANAMLALGENAAGNGSAT